MQKHVYLRNGVRWSDFDEFFYPQRTRKVYWRLFVKIIFPPLLVVILNFSAKCNRSEIEGFQRVYWRLFVKIGFLPLLAAKKSLLATFLQCTCKQGQVSDFNKIFDPQAGCRVYWQLFSKNVFPPLLAAILNFYVKHKNMFISEKERDRAILTKFLTHRVYAESTGNFYQKNFFLATFGGRLEFLRKTQKRIYLGSRMR